MSSYHLMRNFIALLRTLGYPRFISQENFRIPNFPLMADILAYLIKRFDSSLEVNCKIDTEQERLTFVRNTSQLMVNKAHLDINIRNLYMADVNAVQEMIKLAKLIQDAWLALNTKNLENEEEMEDGFKLSDNTEFDRTMYNNFRTIQLTSEILQMGTELYDLLGEQDQNKDQRQIILGKQLPVEQVESIVRQSTQQLQEEIVNMQNRKGSLEQDNDDLSDKIERKYAELNRNKKRLQTLYSQRPAYMDELEKVEQEIIQLYDSYVVNSRCLYFMEQKLEEFEELERMKLDERNEEIKQMLEQMRVDEFLKEGKDLQLSPSNGQLFSEELGLIEEDDNIANHDDGSDLSTDDQLMHEVINKKSVKNGRQKTNVNERKLRMEKKERSLMANTVTVNTQRSGQRSSKTARIYSFGSLLENDDDDDGELKSDLAKMTDSEIDLDAIEDTDDDSVNSTEFNLETSDLSERPVPNESNISEQMAKLNFDKTNDDF